MERKMKKIYMLMEDYWHKREVIVPCMEAALGAGSVTAIVEPASFPWESLKPEEAIFVSQKGDDLQSSDGAQVKWVTPERENLLWDFVNAGGSALFIHSGTVLDKTKRLYPKLVGGIFLQHPQQCPVTYVPIKGSHPIVEGVEPFTVDDEHYHCQVNMEEVTPFLTGSASGHASVITGWCREIGRGRTVTLTPGHTLETVTHPGMSRLVSNAVAWLET
jgi:hypothetical protein